MIRVCLIGYGAIAKTIECILDSYPQTVLLAGVLEHSHSNAQATRRGVAFFPALQPLLDARPDVVVECAGHDAVRLLGPEVLRSGIDLVVASVGALADIELEQSLRRAAEHGCARLIIPSGAIAGLDGIAAARIAGIDRVIYKAKKAPLSWKGTLAEELIDLEKLTSPAVFFTGNARDACTRFPKNANVTGAIALAGVGFDKTEVALEADPGSTTNEHHVLVEGPFGSIEIKLKGYPLPDNPKTSMLAAYSLVNSLLGRSSRSEQ